MIRKFIKRQTSPVLALLTALVLAAALACGGGTETVVKTIEVEKIVEKEVIKEVPVDRVVEKEVVKEVVVDRVVEVVKEVVKEVNVPGKTVVVEKEVVKEVNVPGKTVVVEIIVTPTPGPEPGLAPAAASKAPRGSKQAAGEVVFATTVVGGFSGGLNSQGPMRIGHNFVCEDLFMPSKTEAFEGLIATDWSIDDDMLGATVSIQQGAMHHGGYGELTAEDVAFSYNDANPGTNPESITDGSGDYMGFLGTNKQEALDKYTVKLNWASFGSNWALFYFGQDGLHACIQSKKAFDENGGYEDTTWSFEHMIGTGPYELKEFSRDDKFVFEGVQGHWRKTPDVKKLTQLMAPDETVRLAMLETGEADIASLGSENMGAALRGGFTTASSGSGSMFAVWFPGNLWEKTHPKTGEKLERNTYVHDIAWIGNPDKPNDSDNPDGMDDMEQARLVREALAWSVDRELLLEVILLGNGSLQHSVHFDSRDGLWDTAWEFGYDPGLAGALLDQAGFPKGDDGWRFSMPMYGWSGGASALMTDAVAGMFRDVGVEAQVNHYQYSVWRPTVVTRSATMPWMDGWTANRPYDEPIGAQCSSVTRGGKSRGAEAAACTRNYVEVGAELDYDKRISLAREFAAWNRHNVLHFGVASSNNALIVNPEHIASWDMYPGRRYVVNSWENIVLK